MQNLNQQPVTDVRYFEPASLFGVDESNKKFVEESPWYEATGDNFAFTRYMYIIGQQFIRKLAGVDTPAAELKPSEGRLLEWYQNVLDAGGHTRVSRTKKGFSVFIPIWNENGGVIPVQFLQQSDWYRFTREKLIEMGEFFPEFFDPDAIIDKSLPLSIADPSITEDTIDAADDESFEAIKRGVKSFRFISPRCANKFSAYLEGQRNENARAAWTNRHDADQVTDQDAQKYTAAIFQARNVVLFMELEVSTEAAEFICQTEPTLSLLGEYFIRMGEWLFDPSGVFVHNVVPISKIAEANKNSQIQTIPRVNEYDLAVDAKGRLLWIPTADNAEFVEQEIEQGGMQPNGEWTRVDCVDPENTEYVVEVGADGRSHRVKRPKGRNRLMLTDWHNSRLSYTKDDGNMEIMDISMFRPARPGQIYRTLTAKLIGGGMEDAALKTSLSFAIERGKEIGIKITAKPEWFDAWATQDQAKEMVDLLNKAQVLEYFNKVIKILNEVRQGNEIETANGMRQVQGDELLALDEVIERDWLCLNLLHENSPIVLLRPVAHFLRLTFDRVMVDPGAVFGRYVVRTTLGEMAALVATVHYAGKASELKALDEEDRKQYIQPDLDPVDAIEVRDVPFVSSRVALFPHQVKAWNWLKNRPKNAVLDVAAGGGKTLLTLLEIAYQIGKGLRWPLVVCPEDLIKNYINDAQMLFAGRMNMVVLNNTTMSSKEWGEEKLLQLVEHAPVNTIFITDYNFIVPHTRSKRVQKVMYGTIPLQISLNNEFLKKIKWGGIWMDESHKVKNPSSIRNKELARLTCVIDYKRELSGTYISDNLTDAVGQMNLIDPQVFGDVEQFEENYFVDGRRSAPRPGASKLIRKAMAEHANVITIRRKEWAALLPRRDDSFHPVEMTPAQYRTYLKILDLQKEELETRIKEDASLRAALGLTADGDMTDDEQDVGELLDGKLGFYLQRLERFITAPGSDPLGAAELTGDDLKSPKIAKIEEIIRKHIANNVPGKILIWTQYVESAAYTFRNLSPDLQAKFVHYKASDAEAAMAEFQSNPNKIGMVGCEKSMNTGHNLQFCSRIIRLETVWNWGTLEQGESRINRPKRDDPRLHENGGQGIFYDWVFCNKSMDVTKNSRMISKLISTIKFYEQDNAAYQELEEPEPIRLTKDNIFEMNDWEDDERGCARYFQVYEQYQVLEQAEFDKFVEDPANRTEPYVLEEGEILPGSGLLQKVPYIPQMQIFGQEQLGLIPFVQYVSSEYSDNGQTLLADDADWSPEGLKVHTEYGDCVCKGYNRTKNGKPTTIRVITPSGSTETVQTTMAWVITKDTANGTDIRAAIAKRAGAKVDEVVVPKSKVKSLPPKTMKESKETREVKRAPTITEQAGFEVYVETYDNYLSLVVNSDDPSVAPVLPELEKLGFHAVPEYWYAKVRDFRALRKWIDTIQTKVEIAPPYLKRLEEDYAIWKKGQSLEKFAHGLAQAQRKNFLLEQVRPADLGIIKPYIVVQGNNVFLCLNKRVNSKTYAKVSKVVTDGVKWRGSVQGEHWAFFRSKPECQIVLKEMFAKFNIENRKDVMNEFTAIKLIKVN